MAWVSVSWDQGRQDQTQTTYSPDDGSTVQQTIVTYIAVSDSQLTTCIEAESASAKGVTVPVVGALYTIGGQYGFLCVRRLPKRTTQSPFAFEIQCEFQRKFKQQPQDTPQKWATDINISGVKFTQTTYVDKDGKPVQNSAGQAYDPGAERTFYDEAISISYNTLKEESAALALLRGKVNSGNCSFNVKGCQRSFTARQLLLDDATISTSYVASDSTSPVYKVAMNFVARQDTFINHILDQGYFSLDAGTGKLVACKDLYGDHLSAPIRLDGSGNVLAPGANPVYKDYKIEGEVDFTSAFAGL
jgi:hypothetical protein